MIAIISIIVFALGVIKPKSKIMFGVTCLFMWILMAFTYGNADEAVYIARYTQSNVWEGQTELLYGLLIDVSNSLGLSFWQFKAVITAIQMLLIASTVWKYSKQPNLVMFLYFLCPFMLNIAQMRHALASAVFIFGARYLLEEYEDKPKYFKITYSDIKYVICIFVATLIHTASLIWLVLLFAKKFSFSFNVFFTAVVNILILFVVTPSNLVLIASKFGASDRIAAYLSDEYQTTEWRHYGQIIWVLFVAIIVYIICFHLLNNKKTYKNIEQTRLVLKLNVVILCICGVLLRYTGEVYRLQEGLFILNYILITNSLKKEDYSNYNFFQRDIKVLLLAFVYVLGVMWMMILQHNVQTILLPVFQNNYFFELFL